MRRPDFRRDNKHGRMRAMVTSPATAQLGEVSFKVHVPVQQRWQGATVGHFHDILELRFPRKSGSGAWISSTTKNTHTHTFSESALQTTLGQTLRVQLVVEIRQAHMA